MSRRHVMLPRLSTYARATRHYAMRYYAAAATLLMLLR